LALSAVACLGVWLSAQQPAFRTRTDYVVVDAVVTDKDDRPITDLTIADFEIRERGRVQTITDFEHITVPLGSRSIGLDVKPGPPPDVFSNAPPARSARAFVFVLHQLEPKDIVPIKNVMVEFLRALSPEDTVAVVYSSRSDVSQDFTRDEGLLLRAVDNLNEALGLPVRVFWDPFMKDILRTLADARESRRAVVLVSNGMLVSATQETILETFDLAKRLNIPIYTLDPRGLMAPELGLEAPLEFQTPEYRAGLDRAIFTQKQGMMTIAENTNGRAFVNAWSLTKAARELIADNGSFYLLGFYPTPYARDGKFHGIDVAVKRPDVRVRARQGYMTEGPRLPTALVKPKPVDALAAGLPGGDLPLRGAAMPLALSRNGARTLLTFDIAYPEVVGGTPRVNDQVHFVWLALDPDAKVKGSGQNTVSVPLVGTTAGAQAFAVDDLIELPKGRLTLRLGVTSKLLGAQGTVHIPVDVPAADASSLLTSPIMLGLASGPLVRIAVLGETTGVVPFHPTTTRMFAVGQRLRVFARVFAPQTTGAITADLSLQQSGATMRSMPMQVTPAKTLKGALECEALLDLTGLQQGRYVLELTARAASGKTQTQSIAIEIQ
jgi:VWFA-related protein